MDAEQQRRGRLKTAIDRDASLTQQAASAFLRTTDGKGAVANSLSRMKKEEESKALVAKGPGGSNQTAKKRAVGASAATNVEARKEVAGMFVRRRQALIKHDFNAASPPPLRCPRPDCDATFVRPDHYVRHAAEDHPSDDPGIAELALVINNPVGLALVERWVGMPTTLGESGGISDRERVEALHTSKAGEAANASLCLWKAIEDWRTVTTSSTDYQQLGRSIFEIIASMDPTTNKKGSDHFPGEFGDAFTGSEPNAFGSLGTTGQKHATVLHDHPMEYPSDNTVDPSAFAEASWQALVSLNSAVGRAFFSSAPYARYLDEEKKPLREAVEAAAADIAKRKRVESLAEARNLRAAACLRVQERMVNDFAETAVSLFLQGSAATSFLGDLVDEQVHAILIWLLWRASIVSRQTTNGFWFVRYGVNKRFSNVPCATLESTFVVCTLRSQQTIFQKKVPCAVLEFKFIICTSCSQQTIFQ